MQQLHNTIMGNDHGAGALNNRWSQCILHLVLPCISELFNLQNDEREKKLPSPSGIFKDWWVVEVVEVVVIVSRLILSDLT